MPLDRLFLLLFFTARAKHHLLAGLAWLNPCAQVVVYNSLAWPRQEVVRVPVCVASSTDKLNVTSELQSRGMMVNSPELAEHTVSHMHKLPIRR